MADDKMTKQQYAAIRKLTRAANRRIERATGGMKSALQYYAERLTGEKKWSSAMKGKSYQEAAMQIKLLEKFMRAETTTITGWKRVKKQSVKKANETLSGMGYDLTDEELAELLEQLGESDNAAFYKAVNLVQAAKYKNDWQGSKDQIADAISEKVSNQEALRRALKARDDKLIF